MTNHAPNNAVISTGQRTTFGSAFTLDGVGNRTQVELTEPLIPSYNAEAINYTYYQGNILHTADGATYTHDANGNRTSKTNGTNVTNYTYDSLNRLTQVVNGTRQTQYIYNGLGQRVAKIDNGVQTNYLVDPNGILPQVLAETDASNNLISFYVYDGAGLVAKITPSNQYYFYHYDGLGSTIAITDSSAQVINSYAYSPEGLVGGQETISNAFKYVGRYGVMDEGNGLLFMRARYYDPEVGRFVNKDPIGYAGGKNLYGYAENNPVNYMDTLGLATYYVNRKIGGETVKSQYNPISHTFVAVTDKNGKVIATYSWGNESTKDDNKRINWALPNQREDVVAAEEAIQTGDAVLVSEGYLDPYVMRAYEEISSKAKPQWWSPFDNCKHEAYQLILRALKLRIEDIKRKANNK